MRKIALLLLFVMVLGMLCGCQKPPAPGYQVEVRTEGGRPLEDITVQIFAAEDLSKPLAEDITNGNGLAEFDLEQGSYVVKLEHLPLGYYAPEEYPLRDSKVTIEVETKLLTGSDRNQISHLAAGDVMFDLDVTLTTGETMNLAQVLSQKKAVVLNFWFADCGYCPLEFPAIKQAYLQYADQLEVLALSPYDSPEAIKQYQGRHSLPFPMASCHASWPMAFGISGYPTTVIVDRYGVICAVHTGAVPDAATWEKMFAHFTAENYVQKLFDSLTDVG